MAKDTFGRSIQGAFKFQTHQQVSYDATAQSAALNAQTKLLRLIATTNAHVETGGTNPTATTASLYLPAGVPVYLPVTAAAGWKVAALKATGSSAGILHIGECLV